MDTQKAFCAPRHRLSSPAIYIVSAILLRFVLMTHNGSRADLHSDLSKAAIVIEHLLFAHVFHPETRRLKHAGSVNRDAVLNPVRHMMSMLQWPAPRPQPASSCRCCF